MQSLTERHNAPTTLRALSVLAARLAGRPETEDLIAEVEAQRAAVREAFAAHEDALVRRMAATQEVAYRDELLDEAVMRLSRRMLERVDGRRDDPRYRAVFVEAPSRAMKPRGGERQRAFVEAVLEAARGDEEAEALQPLLQDVADKAEALGRATEQRAKRAAEVLTARQRLQATVEAAQAVYNEAYLKLRLRLPGQRALVESFFPTLRARSSEQPAEA